MTEFARVTQGGKLVSQQEWESHIKELHASTQAFDGDLLSSLRSAVSRRIPSQGEVGVFLSGGIDSTFLAFLAKEVAQDRLVGFTAGLDLETSSAPDLAWAHKAAATLGIPLHTRTLDLDEAREVIEKAARILHAAGVQVDAVSVGVGAVVVAAGERALEEGVDVLFSGLGSEEIFAGYQRHGASKDINEECWRGLSSMWGRDLNRDAALASSLGLTVLTPFLDPDVVRAAMQVPGEEKIMDGYKKHCLRKIAEEAGLPKEFAWRKKKAAQYGSKTDAALLKIAKRAGFTLRREYLASLAT